MCARRRTFFSCSHKKRRQKKCAPLAVTLRCATGSLRCSRARRCRRTHFAAAQLRADNCGQSEHEAWACCAAHARPTRCASRHGQKGWKPNSGHRCARPGLRGASRVTSPHGLGFDTQVRPVPQPTEGQAQRWPVRCPHPFWMRLGRGVGGVARAPQDARAS